MLSMLLTRGTKYQHGRLTVSDSVTVRLFEGSLENKHKPGIPMGVSGRQSGLVSILSHSKTKNFSLPTSAASRHTTPLRGYFLSSRFICEATNHSSSRFCYEATGTKKLRTILSSINAAIISAFRLGLAI